MPENPSSGPESTAVRVALWRALHPLVDAPPHVLVDDVGLKLIAPDPTWRQRGDMHPDGLRRIRTHIVARQRFIDDLVADEVARGIGQYVLLGAGLDTFAQRRTELASRLRIFEVDRAGPQAWKRQRLTELGYGVPEWLKLVSVDFESGPSWWDQIVAAGFDPRSPAVVTCTGVTLYLTREATTATLRELRRLAPGSTVAMTFMLPVELLDAEDRPGAEFAKRGAAASGTPFIGFYAPDEMLALARQAGFDDVRHVSSKQVGERYFANRADGLFPGSGEDFLIART